jgi:hypothetical protein
MKYKDFFKEGCVNLKPRPIVKNVKSKELSMGVADEKEHTDDVEARKTIALQHLKSEPNYYEKLKKAGLSDDLKEGNGLFGVDVEQPDTSSVDNGVRQPDVSSVDKQTAPGTTYEKVKDTGNDVTTDCNGSQKTNVDSPTADPTPTDHVTGGMSSAPSNPNIISKEEEPENNVCKTGFASFGMTDPVSGVITPQDVDIDIAESKKILNKMMKETKTSIKKEGYGGDPDTDKAYVKDKRWTVKYKQ